MPDIDTQAVALDPKGLEAATEAYNKFECGSDVDHVRSIIRAYLSAAQEGREAVAYRYRYVDPVSGRPVWRYGSGLWNGQQPSESQPLFTHPAPAQPAAQVVDIDALAQEIRRVDGSNTLGAGALSEALAPFLSAHASPDAAVVEGYVLVPRREFDAFYKEAVSLSRLCDYREREAFIIAQGAFDRALTAAKAGEDGR